MIEYLAKFELDLNEKPTRILHVNEISKEYQFEIEFGVDPIDTALEYLSVHLTNKYLLKNLYELKNISLNERKINFELYELKKNSLEELVS